MPVMPVKKKLVLPGEGEARVQATAMGRLAEGLEGPSQGLQAGIGQGRSAVAQFAKDTQRNAAATAVKTGGLGQGTQNSLQANARQTVMSQLGANEANNAKMISDEGKSFMDKALEIGQQNKQLQQNQNQFERTAGQEDTRIKNQAGQFDTSIGLEKERVGQGQQQINNQASQFATTAGQNQQQIDNQKSQFAQSMETNKDQFAQTMGMENTKLIATLGADIPVVASKLMATAMGQTGQPLSDAEKGDLKKWYDDAKARGEKIDSQMETLITKMVTDATAPKSAMTVLAEQDAEQELAKRVAEQREASGNPLTATEQAAAVKAGAYESYTPTSFPPPGDGQKALVGKTINVGGTAYKVTGYQRLTGTVSLQGPDGKSKQIWGGKLQDRSPNAKGN